MTDSALDELLLGAASATRTVSDDLLGRVLEDAYALQPAPVLVAKAPARAKPLLSRFWSAMGGVGGMAGLTAVALCGVWIGISEPESLTDFADTLWPGGTLQSVELIPDLEMFVTEG
jgi:hypothetical protein